MLRDVIFAIDIGSSSIRCTAYWMGQDDKEEVEEDEIATVQESMSIAPIPSCSVSSQRYSVEPISGSIRLFPFHHDNKEHKGLVDTVSDLLDQVLVKLRTQFTCFKSEDDAPAYHVVAVGFSSFVMNLVAVNNETGALLGDFFTLSYACNTPSAIQHCHRLKQELSESEQHQLYQATGAPLHTAYALPQLCALYSSADDNDESMLLDRQGHTWQTLASHCIARWTGHQTLPITYSEASWTGLLNIQSCNYDNVALSFIPPTCQQSLPPLVDYTEFVQGISQYLQQPKNDRVDNINPYWERFPELRHSKFFLGIGDGACANVGSKCTIANRIAVTIGTSAAARVVLPYPVSTSSSTTFFQIPQFHGLFCYRIDKRHVLIGGALTDGGSVVDWAREFLNLSSQRDFERCMEQVKVLQDKEINSNIGQTMSSSNNLLMVPFLSGERSTGFRAGATGALLGLTRMTTSADFLKSCLEGVSLRLKAILDLIVGVCKKQALQCDDQGVHSSLILPIVIGSGKAMEINDIWRQMISDCSGLQVILDKDTEEGTSRGVVRLISVALKGALLLTCPEPIHISDISKPNPAMNSFYAGRAAQQNELIFSIAPLFSK